MKKKLLFCFFMVLIVSGCSISKKEPINLSFTDTQNIFAHNMSDFYLNTNFSIQNVGSKYKDFCSFDGGNPSFKFYSSIDLSGFTDYIKNKSGEIIDGMNFDNEIIFDFYYQDMDKMNGNNLQGNLSLKKVDEQYFAKLSQGIADFGTGNYEGDFVNLLIENLGNKWIKYDPTTLILMTNIKERLLNILQNLGYSNLFTQLQQVTYEGDTAYKVDISDEFKQNMDIKGTLIVRDNDLVEFKFDDYEFDLGGKKYYVKGNISDKYGFFSVKDSKESNKSIDINYSTKKNSLIINISSIQNFEILGELKLTINDFWNPKDGKENHVNGELILSPNLIYGSNLENEIKININCSYEKNILSGNFVIQEPDSYILLDQILGDSFSLESILNS